MAIQGRMQGIFQEITRDGHVVREVETFTCGHCSRVIQVPHKMELGDNDVGEFCLACMKPICPPCKREMVVTGKCVPLQAKLDRLYAQATQRRQLFKAMGI